MTTETNQGARRVRVVPRHAGSEVDAPTEVLPTTPGPVPTSARPVPTSARPAPAAPPAHPVGPPTAGRPARPDEARGRPRPDDGGESGAVPERRNGMGTPALVLGLLAGATAWTGWAGVVLGLFAAAAGYLGARRAWKGLATDGARSLGGLALGAVALVWGGVVVSQTLFGTGTFGDGLTLDQCLAQASSAHEMHMCKSQHITEFNQRYPSAAE